MPSTAARHDAATELFGLVALIAVVAFFAPSVPWPPSGLRAPAVVGAAVGGALGLGFLFVFGRTADGELSTGGALGFAVAVTLLLLLDAYPVATHVGTVAYCLVVLVGRAPSYYRTLAGG